MTPDGTCLRDYIHVVDARDAAALEHMTTGTQIYNLGTGKGVSVLEVIAAFERANGQSIPYTVAERRAGDVAVCFMPMPAKLVSISAGPPKNLSKTPVVMPGAGNPATPNGYSNG